jgi:hypothetical protein
MADFITHWDTFFSDAINSNVDVIASMHEDGVNHFLRRHFEIDATLPIKKRRFFQKFERKFKTFDDERLFKITLELKSPLEVRFPPFTYNKIDSNKWQNVDYPTESGLIAKNTDFDDLIEIVAPSITITMEWPRLNDTNPPKLQPWSFTIPPFEVYSLSYLQLIKEDSEFFVKIIPKKIKLDIPRENILEKIALKEFKHNAELAKLFNENEEKFVDLFIIATNIAAYEQTPKLVTSIKIPIPTIQERPLLPAAFDISNNIMTVGFGLDDTTLEQANNEVINQKYQEFNFNLKQDIENAGGLYKMVYDDVSPKRAHFTNPKTQEDFDNLLVNTNKYLDKLKTELDPLDSDSSEELEEIESLVSKGTFAFGVNEYLFDELARAALPSPKHDCTDSVRILDVVKGHICSWTRFNNVDITISKTATNGAEFKGECGIDIGGAIHACVKRFWDCSWRWTCSKLRLGIKGRPGISLKINSRPQNGIRLLAQVIQGDLRIVTNLRWPFNKVIEFFSSLVFKTIIAFINILAGVLSFVLLKPKFDMEDFKMSLRLKSFSNFYFERKGTDIPIEKKKFIAFKTDLSVTKL